MNKNIHQSRAPRAAQGPAVPRIQQLPSAQPTAAELFCCLSDFSDLFDGACAAASELAAPPVSSGGKRKAAAQW